jgi:replicative DNA helicase
VTANVLPLRPLDLDHSLEAERAVLGALLVDERAIDAVDQLDAEWFYFAAHQEVARALLALVQERKPIDPVMLHQRLEATGKMPEPVPPEMPFALGRSIGSALNIVHYVSIVRNTWALRKAKILASSFATSSDALDATAAIGALQRDLSAIETGRGARIVTAAELVAQLYQQLSDESERKVGTEIISTGFSGIDDVVGGFEPGILHMYAARPGVGKSALTMAFAAALGARGIPTAVFWWEDSARKFALRMAATVGGIPTAQMRHGLNMHAPWWDRLATTADKVATWPVYVEATKGLTAREAAQRMRRLKREKGVRVVIADHLGEIRFEQSHRGERTDLALGDAAGVFRDEADALGICPVLFHQLGQKAETEKGEPRLGWLFNSDVLGQKARVVGFITREAHTVRLLFVKATYGAPGTKVELGFDPETMRIFEPQPPLPMGEP